MPTNLCKKSKKEILSLPYIWLIVEKPSFSFLLINLEMPFWQNVLFLPFNLDWKELHRRGNKLTFSSQGSFNFFQHSHFCTKTENCSHPNFFNFLEAHNLSCLLTTLIQEQLPVLHLFSSSVKQINGVRISIYISFFSGVSFSATTWSNTSKRTGNQQMCKLLCCCHPLKRQLKSMIFDVITFHQDWDPASRGASGWIQVGRLWKVSNQQQHLPPGVKPDFSRSKEIMIGVA